MTDTWLRGAWMQTFTGAKFYPLDPRVAEINPIDIAHSLSLICRYGGHTRRFYSVAEHCLLLSYAVSDENALWALLHDAAEAYVGDMVRPLKLQMPEYRTVEDKILEVLAARFDLVGTTIPDEVKDADTRILLDERAAILTPTGDVWETDGLERLGVEIVGYEPPLAELLYAERLNQLLAERAA